MLPSCNVVLTLISLKESKSRLSIALKESGKKKMLKENKIDHKEENNMTLVSIRSFVL